MYWGSKPKSAELIWLQKIAESLRTTTRYMDCRLRDTLTKSRKKQKIWHIGCHSIKVPQTVAWVTANIAILINSAGLGLDPLLE
jgi:hypothetical protein